MYMQYQSSYNSTLHSTLYMFCDTNTKPLHLICNKRTFFMIKTPKGVARACSILIVKKLKTLYSKNLIVSSSFGQRTPFIFYFVSY